MGQIRAVLVDPEVTARLSLGKADEPTLAPSEALVRVSAISLNRGEVRRAQTAEPGFNPGWDLAGTVEKSAADGTGPQVGARVVAFLASGAWAELTAVPTNSLAELPEGVSFTEAATLPGGGPRAPRRAREARTRGGAHEIAIGEDAESAGAFGPYHLILESVGGKIL